MIDPILERRLRDVQELVELWNRFHEYLVLGVKADSITPEKEQEFLELKSRIAMLHDSFMDSLTHDQKIAQNIITIISHCLTLRHLRRVSVAEIKKMEIEWHEAYLLLNETIGALEEQRRVMEKVPAIQYRTRKLIETISSGTGQFIGSSYFKILIALLVIGFIIWGIPALNLYDYGNLKKYKYTKKLVDAWGKFSRDVFGADYPFEEIKEIKRDTSQRPEGLKESRDPRISKDELIRSVYAQPGLNIVYNLRSSKDFKLERYPYRGGTVDLDMFLLDSIEAAENVAAGFRDWSNRVPDRDKQIYPYHLANVARVFSKLNLVVFVRSVRSDLRDDALAIFRREFGLPD